MGEASTPRSLVLSSIAEVGGDAILRHFDVCVCVCGWVNSSVGIWRL